MYIFCSFLHTLFQFCAMINRGMKQVLQLLFRNKYIAFETNISLLFSQYYDLPFTPYRQIFVKVKKVETLY